jgi:hypothetical protein
MVDLIKSRVDPNLVIPVTLRIEPRTRVAQGKTKQFTVVTVGLRGATAMQILAGAVPALELEGGPERLALEAGPSTAPDVSQRAKLTAEKTIALAKLVKNIEQLQQLWKDAAGDDVLTDDVKAVLTARAEKLKNGKPAAGAVKPASAPPAPAEVVDGEPEPDATAVWMQIMSVAGNPPLKWSTERLEKAVGDYCGKSSDECNGWELATFLDAIKNGQVPS